MHPRCCRPVAGNIVGALYHKLYTQSSAPEDGQNNCPKHVELIGIINKPLLLHLVGCLYYLYKWCTVKQISNIKSGSTSISKVPQFLKGNFFVVGLDCSTFVLLVRATCGWRWVKSIGEMILTGTTKVLEWKPVLMPLVHHKFHLELHGTEPGSSRWKPGDYPLNHVITFWRLK